jgi:type IV pilus assembly protein PilC
MNEVKNANASSPRTVGSVVRPFNPTRGNASPNGEGVRPIGIAYRATAAAFSDADESSVSENGYNFIGIDSRGETVKGFVQTSQAQLAAKELERAGISVQSISERKGGRQKDHRPTRIEIATLAEQFGDLMEIGESPTQICRLLAIAQTNKVLSRALNDAGERVRNGWSLSDAFDAQRDNKGNPLFPVTFICALRIGEEIGTESNAETGQTKSAFLVTLRRFAEGEKKADAIRSKIRSAMMYPIVVIAFCILAVTIVMYVVMPKMMELYTSLLSGPDAQLPIVTRILVEGSNFLTSWLGVVFMIAISAGLAFFARWAKSPAGSTKLRVLSLRMPIFGSFFRQFHAAETLRTLAMLSSGIPSMTERFLIAAETSTNQEYSNMLLNVRQRFMTESTDLHKLFVPYPFLMGKEFESVLLTFEKTADMQTSFHNYAKVVETRAERELENALFFLQNFSVVPVGVFVAFILVALYSPMFSLAEKMGQ